AQRQPPATSPAAARACTHATRLIIGPAGELPRANQMSPLYVLTLRVPGGFPARRPSSSAPAGTSTSSTKAAAAHRSYEPPRHWRPVRVASGQSSSSTSDSESLHASSLLSRVGMAAGAPLGRSPAAARGETKWPGRAVATNWRPTTARLITRRWRFHFIRVPAPDGRAHG
ncbi:hypothetical protein PVAP13_2NG051601, partial [Panicum virgatum]